MQAECRHCKAFYTPKRWYRDGRKTCCSSECRRKHKNSKSKAWNKANPGYFHGRYSKTKNCPSRSSENRKKYRSRDYVKEKQAGYMKVYRQKKFLATEGNFPSSVTVHLGESIHGPRIALSSPAEIPVKTDKNENVRCTGRNIFVCPLRKRNFDINIAGLNVKYENRRVSISTENTGISGICKEFNENVRCTGSNGGFHQVKVKFNHGNRT